MPEPVAQEYSGDVAGMEAFFPAPRNEGQSDPVASHAFLRSQWMEYIAVTKGLRNA